MEIDRQEIIEIILGCDDVKEKDCVLLKDRTPHSPLENRKICATCRAKAILSLIVEHEKLLVEALIAAQRQLRDSGACQICPATMYEIASALKGVS